MKTPSTQNQKWTIYSWMEPRMPLGLSPATELTAYLATLVISMLYSIIHFSWYFDYCLGSLYADAKRTILLSPDDPYVSMLPFWDIAKDGYRGFLVMAFVLLWLAWYHYRYHHQKSKSIYLMKRLPAKNELRKRCLTLPVTAAVVTAVTAAALTVIYYVCYIKMTPEPFL